MGEGGGWGATPGGGPPSARAPPPRRGGGGAPPTKPEGRDPAGALIILEEAVNLRFREEDAALRREVLRVHLAVLVERQVLPDEAQKIVGQLVAELLRRHHLSNALLEDDAPIRDDILR